MTRPFVLALPGPAKRGEIPVAYRPCAIEIAGAHGRDPIGMRGRGFASCRATGRSRYRRHPQRAEER
jgi:hypothetical protein